MRPERLYLLDIVEAADNIAIHIGKRDRAAFLGDVTARAAVLNELTVIGEAAARLPADFRSRRVETPWLKIAAFRNFVVHEYFGLDWPIVWDTAAELGPALRRQVSAVLEAEYPDSKD
jgi:uncharacterized protein with HEPN domain